MSMVIVSKIEINDNFKNKKNKDFLEIKFLNANFSESNLHRDNKQKININKKSKKIPEK
jgi:hypothetical protein